MTGIVVKSVEQLKSVHKNRAHPVVTIVGELADNLLISGVVRPVEQGACHAEVVKLRNPKSPELHSIISVLEDLSWANILELIDGEGGWRIKIYPKPFLRREGN